jgi:hypothetical protein
MTRTASSSPATWASWTSKGYFKIVDRKKDMILVSGFNVYPNEIGRRGGAASGRAGSGGDRRAGREFGRSAEAVRRQEGPEPDRRT